MTVNRSPLSLYLSSFPVQLDTAHSVFLQPERSLLHSQQSALCCQYHPLLCQHPPLFVPLKGLLLSSTLPYTTKMSRRGHSQMLTCRQCRQAIEGTTEVCPCCNAWALPIRSNGTGPVRWHEHTISEANSMTEKRRVIHNVVSDLELAGSEGNVALIATETTGARRTFIF
ncbi:hypothetical protein K402DRAFT_88915 [Aulographum hederae CBS 113979]|uniref:Uncharacterized protein n=1 Tax=Aulographum hederae CBS 113979 TaxID=1176131 RepID=A0A6G1H070_9PEZI|nr:hypothetical protein K402DRAFT_88915 [Aulographum hederae CBS 113979]